MDKKLETYLEKAEAGEVGANIFALCGALGLSYEAFRARLKCGGRAAEKFRMARDKLCAILEARGEFDRKSAGGGALYELLDCEEQPRSEAAGVTIVIRACDGDDGKDYFA